MHSEKLNTLAEYLGLSLVRRVKLADHIDDLMKKDWRNFWFDECDRSHGDDWEERYFSEKCRQEWEPGFRLTLAEQERERLEAIPWIILDDSEPTRSTGVKHA